MNKKKVVLFNPKASMTLPYDGPPIALLMVASLLDPKEYDIKIIDWHYSNFKERIKNECKDAALFGVSCLTGYQIKGMKESVELAKQANPNIKVVCGG